MILALNNGIFSHKGPGLDWSELCHSFCEADTEAIPFFFFAKKRLISMKIQQGQIHHFRKEVL